MPNKRFRLLGELFVLLTRKVKNMNVKLVLISILISAVIWTLGNLVQRSTREFDINLQFANPPTGLILINNPDSLITLELSAQGIDLLTSAVKTKNDVVLDMDGLKPRLFEGFYRAQVPTKYFKKELLRQLGVDDIGSDIFPDSLVFLFDDYLEMKIPVVPKLAMTFKNSYALNKSIQMTPDSVWVKGPASIIRNMDHIDTEVKTIEQIDAPKDIDLKLLSVSPEIHYSHESIQVHIEVDQFTENTFTVPVHVNYFIPGIRIKTYPPEIQISYQVSLDRYDHISDTSFRIEVDIDSLSLLRKDPLIPNLIKWPSHVRNVRMNKESLDYVIIK